MSSRVVFSVVYTVLYGLFNSYPIVFAQRDLDPTQVGLTFIPVLVGFVVLFGLTFWHFTRYRRLYHQASKGERAKIEPEERLIPRKSRLWSPTSQMAVHNAGSMLTMSSHDLKYPFPSWPILVCLHPPSLLLARRYGETMADGQVRVDVRSQILHLAHYDEVSRVALVEPRLSPPYPHHHPSSSAMLCRSTPCLSIRL